MCSFGTSLAFLLCSQLLVCYHSSSKFIWKTMAVRFLMDTWGLSPHMTWRLVFPGATISTSLWGKKIELSDQTCLWQLQRGSIPALEQINVCTLLRLRVGPAWTAFVYKAPAQRNIELGLQGTLSHLSIWLFGQEQRLKADLKLNEWYSICLSFCSHTPSLRVILNGTSLGGVSPKFPQRKALSPGGTLTLGVSHYVNASGEVKAESGNNLLGEIGLFKMWADIWFTEELEEMKCVDGDVVSWDIRQWDYSCPPVSDSSLKCGKYGMFKIMSHLLVRWSSQLFEMLN